MVVLVNMIPRSLSDEADQDSEPNLTVNPTNPLQIVATAFTRNPFEGDRAPIYVSTDGGATWVLNFTVPSVAGSSTGTGDITTAFSGTNRLYGAILRDPTRNLEILRASDFAGAALMATLVEREDNDQPFAHATTVAAGVGAGRDRVYIGNNDFLAGTRTATIDLSLNAAIGSPAFKTVRLESRATAGQNGPQVRPVAHPDGTVYAVYYGWRARTGSAPAGNLVITAADVVVVRDDRWGKGSKPFRALLDPGDGFAGVRVVQGVSFPFRVSGGPGQQRIGGALSIAVDPRDSATVYLAWADQQPGGYTLHVRRSVDRGATWTAADLRTIVAATNPALAMTANGTLGFLYQQLSGNGAGQRWVTHLERTADGVDWADLVLATTPANLPVKQFDPYLGDYDHLVAVADTFFGVFSANNTPDLNNFPNGVTYQRIADFAAHTLLGVDQTPVAVSIDPFFFKVDA